MQRLGWVLAIAVVSACTGTVAPRDIGAPDVSKIGVFYPIDGLVRGRGGADTFVDRRVSHVVINAKPTGTQSILPIREDGSFDFAIFAPKDVLELAGATDEQGHDRGEPAYVRVPERLPARPHFFCCGATADARGTCTNEDEFAATPVCDTRPGATSCADVRECRYKNQEILPLELGRIQVTPPNEDRKVSVTGSIETAGALIRLENRGQRAIGGADPHLRLAQLTDENGRFAFENVSARGDDELVFQVLDLLDNKSPEGSILVPDAPLAALDLVGIYPFRRLTSDSAGTIALRFHPSGIDGRGMCPASARDPVLCFTGGLTHDMVRIDALKFDDQAPGEDDPPPRETQTDAVLINNRGTEGDPLFETQIVVVVIDNNQNAGDKDPFPPRRFDAAKQFIRSLRKRDLVGVVSYGGTVRTEAELGSSEDGWSRQLAAIDALAARGGEGPANVFGGIKAAAAMIKNARQKLPGTIVVLAMNDATGTADEAEAAYVDALEEVQPNRETGFRGYGIYFLGVELPSAMTGGNVQRLELITGFSAEGHFEHLPSIAALDGALGDAAGLISGSFVLLYDIFIPGRVGKGSTIQIDATATIPNANGELISASATYKGPLVVEQP